jgi:hypothetical protein
MARGTGHPEPPAGSVQVPDTPTPLLASATLIGAQAAHLLFVDIGQLISPALYRASANAGVADCHMWMVFCRLRRNLTER